MCGLKFKLFLGKEFALRILVGLARAIRRQIGKAGLGECNYRLLEKNTAFMFCLFSAALNRESSIFRNNLTIELRLTKIQNTYIFLKIFLAFFVFGFKSIIIVLDWVVSTLSFKYIAIIILC